MAPSPSSFVAGIKRWKIHKNSDEKIDFLECESSGVRASSFLVLCVENAVEKCNKFEKLRQTPNFDYVENALELITAVSQRLETRPCVRSIVGRLLRRHFCCCVLREESWSCFLLFCAKCRITSRPAPHTIVCWCWESIVIPQTWYTSIFIPSPISADNASKFPTELCVFPHYIIYITSIFPPRSDTTDINNNTAVSWEKEANCAMGNFHFRSTFFCFRLSLAAAKIVPWAENTHENGIQFNSYFWLLLLYRLILSSELRTRGWTRPRDRTINYCVASLLLSIFIAIIQINQSSLSLA